MPRVQQKRGTAVNLTSANPTALAGELIVVSDENTLKIGNGVDSYTSLDYVTATPRSHKSTHATGGTDALSPSDIGAAPAASPTFTGDVTIDDKIIHAGDNSAIRFPADDTVTIETAGVERLRVGSSGNVGLGIAPEASRRLAIKANAAGSITGGVLMKSQSTPDGSSRGFLLQCSGTSSDAFVYQFENAPIIFGTNNTIRARIEGNGNVAIGNITPSSLLHVNGVITVSAGSAAAPAIVASGDSNTGLAFATDTLIFSTAGTERLRVDSSGRVGIGAAAGTLASEAVFYADELVLGATNINTGITVRSGSSNTGSIVFADAATGTGQAAGLLQYAHTADAMLFGTNGSEKMRITSAGLCGIGRTSPASALDVNGVITVSAGSAAAPAIVSTTGTSDTGVFFPSADNFAISTGGTERLRIDSVGNVTVSRLWSFELGGNVNSLINNSLYPQVYKTGTTLGNGHLVLQPRTDAARDIILAGGVGTTSEIVRIKSNGAVRFVPLAADPASGNEAGDVYYASASNELKYYNGSAWVAAAPTASPTFTGVITVAAGSAAAPALVSATGTSDTGVFWRAADEMNFSSAGVERMRVSQAGVDIYQLSSGADLARVRLNSSAGSSQIALLGYGASFSAPSVMSLGAGSSHLVASSGVLGVSTQSSEQVIIGTGNVPRLRVKPTGSVRFVPLAADPATGNEAGDVYYASASNELKYYNGSSWVAAAPAASPTFTGDVTIPDKIVHAGDNSAIRFPADDTVTIETTGIERLRVDSSGRVGIGTTNTAALSNADDLVIGDGTSEPGITFHGSTTSRGTIAFADSFSGADAYRGYIQYGHTNNDLRIATDASVRMLINSSGNVGIGTGTATPASRLDVNGVITVSAGSAAAPALVASGDSNSGLLFPAADTVAISTAGVERLRVRSDGNVGIGGAGSSTSPLAISSPLTGGTVVNGVYANPTIGSDVTIAASVFRTFVGTAAASFTLPTLIHFNCTANTFGAGSTVTSQIGFYAGSSLTGATTNVGFRGDIADGANRWNFYALGTAPNYFAGNVGIATTSPTEKLDINSDKIRLRTAKTPASSSDTGNAGDICWDADYLYVCTATNTWKRAALSTW